MTADVKHLVDEGVPFAKKVGVCLEDASPADARVRLPLSDTNLGRQGSVHIGALSTVAEAAAAALVLVAYDRARITFHCKAVELRHRRAARTDLWAKAELLHEARVSAEERASTEGKADVQILVEIVDPGGERVAEAVVTLSLRRL